MVQSELTRKLSDKEKNLLNIIRDLEYGELKIIVQEREPVRVEEIKRSIKL